VGLPSNSSHEVGVINLKMHAIAKFRTSAGNASAGRCCRLRRLPLGPRMRHMRSP